jgi:glycosyltransferase 2 family protein
LNKYLKIIISLLVIILFFLFVYYYIDFEQFLILLKRQKYLYLILAFIVQLIGYYLRAKRFQIILKNRETLTIYSISSIHFFLNKVLPAKIGEISLPILFKKYSNIRFSEGIGALIIFRLFDFLTVIFLFIVSILFVHARFFNWKTILFSVLILMLLLLFIVKIRPILSLLENSISYIKIKKIQHIKEKFLSLVKQISLYISSISFRTFMQLFLFSISNWLMTYVFYYLIISSFNLNYSYPEVVFAATFSSFTLLIPVSGFGNIGTFEAGWAIGFILLGMSKDLAIPVGLFSNVLGILMNGVIAGFGYFYLSILKNSFQNVSKNIIE